MDQPPRKRARSSASDDEPVPNLEEITRSPDFWFTDGSVVLQAQSTQYRVHMSILSLHSTIFRDMFEIPQPLEGEPSVEGCAIVHLSDSAEDVSCMLSSLYKSQLNDEEIPTFAMISAWLRLGKKYDIEHQRKAAVQCLRNEFPTTLSGWVEMPATYSFIKYQGGLLFAIIHLALETDTSAILPAAYLSALCKMDTLIMGETHDDGSLSSLPKVTQLTCFMAREKILKDVPNILYPGLISGPTNLSCISQKTCTKFRLHTIRALWASSASHIGGIFDPMDVSAVQGLCNFCSSAARSAHEIGRQKLWDNLPVYLGLSTWEDVLK